MTMEGDPRLYEVLASLGISFEYHGHPPVPTVEAALEHWKDIDATHCKNLFFRNHKGNRHYLVIIDHLNKLAIRDLEQLLRQGKLSLASDRRLEKYLGLTPGSVTPFGLINDTERHVHVFIDEKLRKAGRLSFHPNINTATLVVSFTDFIRVLDSTGNSYEFIRLT
jgi:Ala-tRNA(Pro) deacylase